MELDGYCGADYNFGASDYRVEVSSGWERGVWVERWAAFGSIEDLAVGFACTVWLAVLRVDAVSCSGYMAAFLFFSANVSWNSLFNCSC